jgi:hypothetical protein
LLLTTWVGFWSWVRSKLWACHIFIWYFHLNHLRYKYSIYQTSHINCIIHTKKKNTVTIYVAQKFKCSTWIGSSTVSLSYSITWKHFTGWESGQLDVLYASICCFVVWHKMAGCTLFWPRLSGQHVKHNGYPTVIEYLTPNFNSISWHGKSRNAFMILSRESQYNFTNLRTEWTTLCSTSEQNDNTFWLNPPSSLTTQMTNSFEA